MKKVFPKMQTRPETGVVTAIFICWFLCFVFLPFVTPLVAIGAWQNDEMLSIIEFVYHAINGLLAGFLANAHIKESWDNVRLRPKQFAEVTLLAIGLMLSAAAAQVFLYNFFGFIDTANAFINVFPMSEFDVLLSENYMVGVSPILGTICFTVFAPVSISVLFYASGFAPTCTKRPWLAYIIVTGIMLFLTGFDILWRDGAEFTLLRFALRLPINLIACWAYQKTDSIIAPIISLAFINLITSIICVLM